jgi:hypothetical protein
VFFLFFLGDAFFLLVLGEALRLLAAVVFGFGGVTFRLVGVVLVGDVFGLDGDGFGLVGLAAALFGRGFALGGMIPICECYRWVFGW